MPEPVGLGAAGELGLRLTECWSRTEKSWARPPEMDAAKKTSKTGLASLKTPGLFFVFLFLSFFFF